MSFKAYWGIRKRILILALLRDGMGNPTTFSYLKLKPRLSPSLIFISPRHVNTGRYYLLLGSAANADIRSLCPHKLRSQ